jgi:hypothetical protein
MVECRLPKPDVAGSIPVARSKFQLANLLDSNVCTLASLSKAKLPGNCGGYDESYIRGKLELKEENKTKVIVLFTGEQDLAVRSAKAFNRLIRLCGGGPNKEPF